LQFQKKLLWQKHLSPFHQNSSKLVIRSTTISNRCPTRTLQQLFNNLDGFLLFWWSLVALSWQISYSSLAMELDFIIQLHPWLTRPLVALQHKQQRQVGCNIPLYLLVAFCCFWYKWLNVAWKIFSSVGF
jgi:hypothetical protein